MSTALAWTGTFLICIASGALLSLAYLANARRVHLNEVTTSRELSPLHVFWPVLALLPILAVIQMYWRQWADPFLGLPETVLFGDGARVLGLLTALLTLFAYAGCALLLLPRFRIKE